MFLSSLRLLLIAALAAILCCSGTEAHPLELASPTTKPTILIVSGASHTPKHFEPLQMILEQSGYNVHNPRLPSNALLPPAHSHQRDVDTIRGIAQQLSDEGKHLLVLMHSYGGFVGTNALYDLGHEQRAEHGLRGGVKWLAYMAALLPVEGETVADILKDSTGPSLSRRGDHSQESRNQSSRALLPPLNPEFVFYNDMTPEDQEWAVAELTGISGDAFAHSLQHEAWRGIKAAYLKTELDHSVPASLQQDMIDRVVDEGTNVRQTAINSSHSPYISQPRAVAHWIESLQE